MLIENSYILYFFIDKVLNICRDENKILISQTQWIKLYDLKIYYSIAIYFGCQ